MSRIYRFFTRHINLGNISSSFNLLEKDEPEIIFQLTKVLRACDEDKIVLLAEDALMPPFLEYHFEIESIDKKGALLKLEQKKVNENELPFELILVLCLPNKPDKLEFILQKAVELGVKKVILVQGDFSQMKHQLRLDRLRKIMIEAAEQSERGYVPELILENKLSDFLKNNSNKEKIFVAMERLENLIKLKNGEDAIIVIGPEGGFSEQERKLIFDLNLKYFSLGKRVLRMETAVILSLGLIQQ